MMLLTFLVLQGSMCTTKSDQVLLYLSRNKGRHKYHGENLCVLWYSSKSITPDSPIGAPSYSINGMEDFTSKKRCRVCRFVEKYGIPSYYVGRHRRFNKLEVDKAWNIESIYFKDWLTIEEISSAFNIENNDILYASAKHRIKRKIDDGEVLYLRKDVEYLKKRKEELL